MVMENYDLKIQEQISQFEDSEIHILPEIFHFWSHNFIRPGMEEVFGHAQINEIYIQAIKESSNNFGEEAKVLSIGCGDGTVELDICKQLMSEGHKNFHITAADISPVLIDKLNIEINQNNLNKFVTAEVQDLNKIANNKQYNVIMANHSLHHIVELEHMFTYIEKALLKNGIFATCDMIGRNGHMRWPETEKVLQMIWPGLNHQQKYNHQLKISNHEKFINFDCSKVGFEGIRSQDILGLIVEKFNPSRFFSYGGFIDILVDRGYGPGFNINSKKDTQVITLLAELNDFMLDSNIIKPTAMMAHFTQSNGFQKYYKGRTAKSSIRLV